MYAIEFQTKLRDGIIEIPQVKRDELQPHLKEDNVRVIVMVPEANNNSGLQEEPSFLQKLLENPIRLPNVEYLTREEAHER